MTKEMRYLRPVAEAFYEDASFRQWVLANTALADLYLSAEPVGPLQAQYGTRNSKGPWWYSFHCGKDSACHCKVGTGLQTDALIILQGPERALGVHFECKYPGEPLRGGQAESYRNRANCWANAASCPSYIFPHDDFVTILVCGSEFKDDPRAKLFDNVIYHDEIAKRIAVYPEP